MPSSFVLLFSRLQRVYAFVEAALFWPADAAKPVTLKQISASEKFTHLRGCMSKFKGILL